MGGKLPKNSTVMFLPLILLLLVPWTFADPVLSIQPPSTSVTGSGTSFSADLNIADVTDLYSFQFDIGFNSAVLSAVSVTEGAFLPGAGTTFFLPGNIDNTLGTISFNADTLIGPISGATGSGTLAVLNFMSASPGTSPIDILNVTLLDSTLFPISSTQSNGSVLVSGGAVPEPATVVLTLFGLMSLGFVVRKYAAPPVDTQV